MVRGSGVPFYTKETFMRGVVMYAPGDVRVDLGVEGVVAALPPA